MKRNNRLHKLEDIGFHIAMMFASIVIGFGIVKILVKLFGYE